MVLTGGGRGRGCGRGAYECRFPGSFAHPAACVGCCSWGLGFGFGAPCRRGIFHLSKSPMDPAQGMIISPMRSKWLRTTLATGPGGRCPPPRPCGVSTENTPDRRVVLGASFPPRILLVEIIVSLYLSRTPLMLFLASGSVTLRSTLGLLVWCGFSRRVLTVLLSTRVLVLLGPSSSRKREWGRGRISWNQICCGLGHLLVRKRPIS